MSLLVKATVSNLLSNLLVDVDKDWNAKGISNLKNLVIKDTNASPIGDVLLKVLDQKIKLRNAADDADVVLEEPYIAPEVARLDVVIKKDGSAAFTGDQSLGGHKLTNVLMASRDNDAGNLCLSGGIDANYPGRLLLCGPNETYNPGSAAIQTPNAAKNAWVVRLRIKGAADVADAVWTSTLHKGFKFGENADFNGFQLKGMKLFAQTTAPAAADIPDGNIALWHDTSATPHWYLCWNEGGTVRKVELT